jgi:hypothetical protein
MHTLNLGDQEASQPVANLLMSQGFATRQSCFTASDGFNKAVFFLKVAHDHIPQRLVGAEALPCRALCEPGFDFGSELHFHENSVGGNGMKSNPGLSLPFPPANLAIWRLQAHHAGLLLPQRTMNHVCGAREPRGAGAAIDFR